MKRFVFILVAFIVFSGFVFSQEQTNVEKSIIGKWKNANNQIYQFTADKKVLVNSKSYATFRFLEGQLVFTYLDSDADYEAGLEFEGDDLMRLTEYKDLGDREKPMLFKRLVD